MIEFCTAISQLQSMLIRNLRYTLFSHNIKTPRVCVPWKQFIVNVCLSIWPQDDQTGSSPEMKWSDCSNTNEIRNIDIYDIDSSFSISSSVQQLDQLMCIQITILCLPLEATKYVSRLTWTMGRIKDVKLLCRRTLKIDQQNSFLDWMQSMLIKKT